MHYDSQIDILSQLLHKSPSQIKGEALELFIKNLAPHPRTAYLAFLEVADQTNYTPKASAMGPGYSLSDVARRITPNPNTTKGRILGELRNLPTFTRAEFTSIVAKAMIWDPAKREFGVSSKFRDLAAADSAWWGTIKGKERLIIARTGANQTEKSNG